MGHLTRPAARHRGPLVAALALSCLLSSAALTPVAGFTGFGATRTTAIYGVEMTFEVDLLGGSPDRLELLLRFGDDEVTVVAPAEISGATGSYFWDAAERSLTPNTPVHYRWRAIDGDRVSVSAEGSLLYDDDRPGLDWRTARIGDATVHWYGGAETQARRFGELTAEGVQQAEAILGHALDGPIDIFVYVTDEDFFGALGPGAREWTGAAAFPELRTVFMWLGGGAASYLETAIVHEVTHVVFNDATDNPFHEPPAWFNEGLAVWSEVRSAAGERGLVEGEVANGLFAFEAIEHSFPLSDRGARLAYAQGATMVDMIIDQHGAEAIARIVAAWREGASDAEALEAGTGQTAEALYADYFADFGADPPQPVPPAAIGPSVVVVPGQSPQPIPSTAPSPGDSAAPSPDGGGDATLPIALLVVGLLVIGAVVVAARRGVQRST